MMLRVAPRALLAALVAAAALWLAFNRHALDPALVERTLRGLGPWAPIIVLYGIAAVLPEMTARGSGHAINMASIGALSVVPTAAVYCATKYAVRAISGGSSPGER